MLLRSEIIDQYERSKCPYCKGTGQYGGILQEDPGVEPDIVDLAQRLNACNSCYVPPVVESMPGENRYKMKYSYKFGSFGFCEFQLIEKKEHTIVIATETRKTVDAGGPGIANAFETIAARVTAHFGIPAERLVWIQGRKGDAYGNDWEKDEYLEVKFKHDKATGRFHSPEWSRLKSNDILEHLDSIV